MVKSNGRTASNSDLLSNSNADTGQHHSYDYFESWKIRVEIANMAFEQEDFVHAEILYKKTINVAISAFCEQAISKQTVSMLLVSFHNIADLYAQQERYLEVKLSLEGAFVYIQTKLKSTAPNSEEAADLTWGLMKAKRQLLTFTSPTTLQASNTVKNKTKTPSNNNSNHVH